MVNGSNALSSQLEMNMQTNAETNPQTQSLRLSTAAKAALKQDQLNVSANALESLTHALRFR
ncbi:hypothetical protein ABID08_005638 [Rhizobium binae]|uniref:Flagellin n=1 Tax=Rhizobium binae TaxID=1138190 RepID=A0ABV2MP73_9HYPH